MMIGIADQFSLVQVVIVLVLLFIAQMVFFRYAMARLNSNPADSLERSDDRESEILGDQPVRSLVGTPRPRRLQPSAKGDAAPAAGEESTFVPVPLAKLGDEAKGTPSEKKVDPYAPLPLAASEKSVSPTESVPVPILGSSDKPETLVDRPLAFAPDEKAAEPASGKSPGDRAPVEPLTPSVSAEKAPAAPISIPPLGVGGPLTPAPSLTETPEKSPAKPEPAPKPEIVPVSTIPRRFFVNPFAKAAPPAEPKKQEPPATAIPPQPEPVPASIESTGEGIVAVSGPTPLEGASQPGGATDLEDSDDVKKRKTPKTPKPVPEPAGLILIPPLTGAGDPKVPAGVGAETSGSTESKTPASVEAKAEPPAGALTLTSNTPEPAKESGPIIPAGGTVPPVTKLVPRPRIFLPANAPAGSAPAEEVVSSEATTEPASVGEPIEAKAAPDEVPAADVAPKHEESTSPADEPKASEPIPEVKSDTTTETPEAKTESDHKPEPTDEPKAIADGLETAPASKSPEEEPKPAAEEKLSTTPPESSESLSLPSLPKEESVASEVPAVHSSAPEAEEPEHKAHEPEHKAPEFEPESIIPVPVPLLPKPEAEPLPTEAPEGALSLATSAPTHPTTTPETVMPSTETTSASATGRASAQLTLGFEITSLQLTPFFKLGAVQLRPLSNVVSLHLIGAQPENPLAAGISFQIDHVELENSKIKSLHLKLLGGSQPAATPQPKLQVNAVELSQASEGAPISITPSDQTSTAVQLLATFTIAAMDFTPSFEIGSLRLEPTSNQVMLRLAPSSRPAALDLPPAFDVSSVQLGGESQISAVALTPSAPKAS